MGMAIHNFKIPTKLFPLVILHIICIPQNQLSTNMFNPRNFMPTKLNDFTVVYLYLHAVVYLTQTHEELITSLAAQIGAVSYKRYPYMFYQVKSKQCLIPCHTCLNEPEWLENIFV